MGRPTTSTSAPQNQTTPTTYHFSHPHPLNLINYNPQTRIPTPPCSACNLDPFGMIYTCTSCNFFLHQKCFEMPNKITHPCHKDHNLTLLPKPDYPEGFFKCDGCGDTGRGFSYTCKPCGIDLHVLCTVMPLSVTHGSHAHKLDLTFESPYADTKAFSCDICKINGSDQWLYRCNFCGFDAHLKCARGTVQAQVQQISPTNNPFTGSHSQAQTTTTSRSVPLPVQPHPGFRPMMQPNLMPHQQYFMMSNAAPVGVPSLNPRFGPNIGQGNDAAMQASIQQMINSRNAMSTAILTAGIERGRQQFNTHFASALNNANAGFLNHVGGGSGGIVGNVLQAAMGGGGMGGNILQAAMGGGGMAGNVLQAAMGGGGGIGGGGGAMDLVQSLIGDGIGGGDLLGDGALDVLGDALGSLF